MSSRLAWAKEQVPDQLELLHSRTLMSSKTKSKKEKNSKNQAAQDGLRRQSSTWEVRQNISIQGQSPIER